MRAAYEIQKEYKQNKVQAGYKRVQIWKLDENNEQVKARIKHACAKLSESENDKELLEEIAVYSNNLLQDVPL